MMNEQDRRFKCEITNRIRPLAFVSIEDDGIYSTEVVIERRKETKKIERKLNDW